MTIYFILYFSIGFVLSIITIIVLSKWPITTNEKSIIVLLNGLIAFVMFVIYPLLIVLMIFIAISNISIDIFNKKNRV